MLNKVERMYTLVLFLILYRLFLSPITIMLTMFVEQKIYSGEACFSYSQFLQEFYHEVMMDMSNAFSVGTEMTIQLLIFETIFVLRYIYLLSLHNYITFSLCVQNFIFKFIHSLRQGLSMKPCLFWDSWDHIGLKLTDICLQVLPFKCRD